MGGCITKLSGSKLNGNQSNDKRSQQYANKEDEKEGTTR